MINPQVATGTPHAATSNLQWALITRLPHGSPTPFALASSSLFFSSYVSIITFPFSLVTINRSPFHSPSHPSQSPMKYFPDDGFSWSTAKVVTPSFFQASENWRGPLVLPPAMGPRKEEGSDNLTCLTPETLRSRGVPSSRSGLR